jgi:chorismate synthase
LLDLIGVEIIGYDSQIGNVVLPISKFKFLISNQIPNPKSQIINFRKQIEESLVRCPDEKVSKKMIRLIEEVRKQGDSVGGIVEIIAAGVPAGWGEPVFGKLSAELAGALMSIPGIKGVEVGSGFSCAAMRGSEHNDVFYATHGRGSVDASTANDGASTMGRVETKTNNAGGILGGISNGMPIVARIAVKPTSSIAKEQETIDKSGRRKKIKIQGRHDPCICPRIVPVAEAMMAMVLVDCYLLNRLSRITPPIRRAGVR